MNLLFKLFLTGHVALFRTTGGKFGSSMAGGKVLLLTTKGKKSGRTRTVPVMFFEHGGDRVVIASFGGSPQHPAWFNNLEGNPNVTVEVPGKRYAARAEIAANEQRTRIWNDVIARMPRFAEYQQKAQGREIPVVLLKETGPQV
jgi:F420H(2)-dependent quinone reductase